MRNVSPLTDRDAGKYNAAAPVPLNADVFCQFLVAVGLTVLLLLSVGGLAVVERLAPAPQAGPIDGAQWTAEPDKMVGEGGHR